MTSLYLSLEEELELLENQLNLEKLYNDLGRIKGTPLSPGQREILHLKLTGHDIDTIAEYLGKDPRVVAVECSRSLKEYIQELLVSEGLMPEPKGLKGKSNAKPKANWSRFIILLDRKYGKTQASR
ncbi:MAG: hypothetical protein F6K30_07660 [Cyanothece sp. SIO2G6]|nr:hypothetical protein [Cyanothece sp. SIO2G6]